MSSGEGGDSVGAFGRCSLLLAQRLPPFLLPSCRFFSSANHLTFPPSPSSLPLPSLHLKFLSNNKRFVRMSSTSAAAAADGVGDASSSSTSTSSASSAIDFLTLCHRLKTTKRTGWIRREIQDPESIADHMYRMAIMGLISSDLPPAIDRNKCIKMAIVHDIAEAIVGDITPADGVPKEEKSRMEREALDHMCKLLGDSLRAKEINELWMEYEDNSSLEAKVVKDFDKVEMILQALEYENGQGKNLDEFFQSTSGKFQTDVGKAWASEIASRRRNGQD